MRACEETARVRAPRAAMFARRRSRAAIAMLQATRLSSDLLGQWPTRRFCGRDELQTLLKGAPHMRDPCRSV